MFKSYCVKVYNDYCVQQNEQINISKIIVAPCKQLRFKNPFDGNIIIGLLTYVKTFDLIMSIILFMKEVAPYVEVLKQLMEEKQLSQQKIADLIGVNQTTVSQWLLGEKRPGYDNILKIYQVFGVEPNDLFGVN